MSVDAATLQASLVQAGVPEAISDLARYRDALAGVSQSAQPASAAVDAVGRASTQSAQGHQQAKSAADQHATASEHLSTISTELTNRLQAQGVPIGALQEGFRSLTSAFGAAGEGASALTVGLGVMAAGVVAAGAVAEISAQKFISMSDSVRELRETTGLSAASVQGMQYALSAVGEGSDSANRALLLFSRNVANAKDALDAGQAPAKGFSDVIEKLHLTMGEFIAASPDERLRMVAQGFSQLSDNQDKAQIAMTLFGRGGAGMISVLSQGNDLLDEGARKTQAWGAAVSDADENGALKFHKSMADLNLVMAGFEKEIGGPVIEAVTSFTKTVTDSALSLEKLNQDFEQSGFIQFTHHVGEGAKSVDDFASSVERSVPGLKQANESLIQNQVATGTYTEKTTAQSEAIRGLSGDYGLLQTAQRPQLQILDDLAGKFGLLTKEVSDNSTAIGANGKYIFDWSQNAGLASGQINPFNLSIKDNTAAITDNSRANQVATDNAQALADAWTKVTQNGGDVPGMLNLIETAAHSTKEEVKKLQEEVLNLFSKPTSEELAVKAQIADVNVEVSRLQALLSNSSPAVQHVAAMQKVYDNAVLTGATVKEQAKAKADLDRVLAETGPAGAAAAADQQRIDKLTLAKGGLDAQLTSLQASRQAMEAHTLANQNNAVSIQTDTQLYADMADMMVRKSEEAAGKISGVSAAIGGVGTAIRGAMAQAAGTGAYSSAGGGGFLPPTTMGSITQGYGPTDESLEPMINGVHFHQGVDIGVPMGTPLGAGGAGRVTAIGHQGQSGLGLSVTVDLGNGTLEQIGHLSQALVQVGQTVTPGQTVGLSGGAVGDPNSGSSTGPHVHYQVTVNGQAVDPATLAAIVNPAGAAAAAGGALPASWYAAIQANESTLPLPAAGAPQPMFGITASSRAVGRGTFASGGTAAASASLGVGPGQTSQALFPSTDAGIAAFNDIWQAWPDAVAAAQKGDFPAFLQALVAHGYAGPGEGAQWPGQVLSHLTPGASLPGASSGLSGFGQLPGAAPDTAAAAKPLTPVQIQNETTTAEGGLNALAQLATTVTSTTKASLQDVTSETVSSQQVVVKSAKDTALARIQDAEDAENTLLADLRSGAGPERIDQDKANVTSAQAAAREATQAWKDADGTLTTDQKAVVDNYNVGQQTMLATARVTSETQTALYRASMQEQHLQDLGQQQQHQAVTQQTVDGDRAALDAIKQQGVSAYQNVGEAHRQYAAAVQKQQDDIAAHADATTQAQDTATVNSLQLLAQQWDQYFAGVVQGGDAAAARLIADQKEVERQTVASNNAMLNSQTQGQSMALQSREDQYRYGQITNDPNATPQARAQAASAAAQIGPLRQDIATLTAQQQMLTQYLQQNPGLTPAAVQQILGQLAGIGGHLNDATFELNHLNDTTKQLPPALEGALASDFNRIVGALGLQAALQAQANGTLSEVAAKIGQGGGFGGGQAAFPGGPAPAMTAAQQEDISRYFLNRYGGDLTAQAFAYLGSQAQAKDTADRQKQWEAFIASHGGAALPDAATLQAQFTAATSTDAWKSGPLMPGMARSSTGATLTGKDVSDIAAAIKPPATQLTINASFLLDGQTVATGVLPAIDSSLSQQWMVQMLGVRP